MRIALFMVQLPEIPLCYASSPRERELTFMGKALDARLRPLWLRPRGHPSETVGEGNSALLISSLDGEEF